MQLRELNLSNSILNSELRELETMSPKWARLHYRMLQLYSSDNTLSGTECTCKSATSKYGMHLQKCNITIWNSPLWAPSLEENEPIIPSGLYFGRHWLRGSVNSGIVYVPGSHPTPSSFWGLWYFFWVGIGWFFVLDGGAAFACCNAFM